MPRASAESRSAAAFRAGGNVPEPPKHLSKAAAVVWRDIAASKPADWFDPGAQILLESYCELAVHARAIHKRLSTLRSVGAWDDAKAWEKRAGLVAEKLSTLATKLRLSVQAQIERHSRKIGERGSKEAGADRLLGGRAVWGESGRAN